MWNFNLCKGSFAALFVNEMFQPTWVVILTTFSPRWITGKLVSSTLKWVVVMILPFPHCIDDILSLQDFAIGLSILLKGSKEDKLKWVFHLYDVNKDGVLTKPELKDVISSVSILYQLCMYYLKLDTKYHFKYLTLCKIFYIFAE